MSDDDRHLTVEDDGRVVAQAHLRDLDPPGTIGATMHVEAGHLPAGTRSQLVAEVFDTARVREAEHFTGVVPRGDAEVLDAVRSHLLNPVTRSVGASVIVEADTPSP